jgi:hypothetical protein
LRPTLHNALDNLDDKRDRSDPTTGDLTIGPLPTASFQLFAVPADATRPI